MLNPLKQPTQMMYEQAGIPHYAKGGDVVTQFASEFKTQFANTPRRWVNPRRPKK